MNEELIEKLKTLAKKECWLDDDDFNPYDFSGGNYNDAFWGGHDAGEIQLAQEILGKLGISY